MKRFVLHALLTVFTAYCLVIATARPAFGYVDPGSGFLAVQTIASVAAGFGYILRKRIRGLFSGTPKRESDEPVAHLEEQKSSSSK